jgi:hypothetical protein
MNNSLFETLNIPFSIDLLQKELVASIANKDPIMTGKGFGGWSVTSSNGSYEDGWLKSKPLFDAKEKTIEEVREANLAVGFKGPQHYRKPTEICTGEVNKVITFLNENGFFPCRARFTLLKAGAETPFHRDYPEWLYGVRLHIPIITNIRCAFEYEDEGRHLPANGQAYLLKINKTHRVYNRGATDRIHFLCDFFDTQQKTEFNKFTEKDRQNLEGFKP